MKTTHYNIDKIVDLLDGEAAILMPVTSWGPGDFFSSCASNEKPNCRYLTSKYGNQNVAVYIQALTNISVGQELAVDYGGTYDNNSYSASICLSGSDDLKLLVIS